MLVHIHTLMTKLYINFHNYSAMKFINLFTSFDITHYCGKDR